MEAKEKELVWLKGQTSGEFDDARIVDAAIGERQVYKRRGQVEQAVGATQRKPKRIVFVMDCR